ncbi:tyrosine-type recombinase/integrase [Streptomyces sp. NBC_01224]|uniref:tyrosine-type recombinase/integrase n=1 Tax=Streptomyces sp. NBC_01224 TaxID=2903783 RepID=UPI002E1351B0|nr:tyrosine-type recombinase/integrase [Streptomyces sp. NBC_01224]
MGAAFSCGEMEQADIELMMQTAYLVLRDTGRRPIEVASLRLKCLETRKDENTLIWDNVKKRRYGRKLPVTCETAEVIKTWQARRRQMEVPSRSRKYLFPSIRHHARPARQPPQDEREEIEEASAVLRKVRATRDHKLLPLTVIRKETPDAY